MDKKDTPILDLFRRGQIEDSPSMNSIPLPPSTEGGDPNTPREEFKKKYKPGDVVMDASGNKLRIVEPRSADANVSKKVYEATPLGNHPMGYLDVVTINENDIHSKIPTWKDEKEKTTRR